MTKPIRPDDVVLAKTVAIPEGVFTIFNELIAENWTGKAAVVKQDDVVARITSRYPELRKDLFQRRWMDVEDSYRAQGWKVSYDKPAYNESYPATYVFSK